MIVALMQLWATAAATPPQESDRWKQHYRDSLRSYIFEHGSASVDCYLSYPIGDSLVDPDFGNNASELAVLYRFLRHALEDTLVCVQEIVITGHSSPDGSARVNERLSLKRAEQFLNHLNTEYHMAEKYMVTLQSVGADWQKLRELIAASPYKWRDDALRIIDGTDTPDRKKMQLAWLGGGDAHKRMYEELYPKLRRVEVKINYDVQCMKQKLRRPEKPDFGKLEIPKLRLRTLYRPEVPEAFTPLMAIKTNLLFDVALMPNIEVEIPLGRRWSLNGEYMFPWWLINNDRYCLQLLSGGAELRYWPGNRFRHKTLTGHFAGLYAGGGKYDLQWKENGYQGEFFIAAGLSYGYSLPLSRRWNMEFSLGIGLLRTDYRHYRARDNYKTLLWQNNGRYTWFGPTKAKISLVWLLGNKKGGRR